VTPRSPARLHVLSDREADLGIWNLFISDIAALSGASAVEDHLPSDGEDSSATQSVLVFAATTTDPVLVIPSGPPPTSSTVSGLPRLHRILAPIDGSPSEQQVLRKWVRQATSLGIRVEHIHVLTETTRPAMWEGAGHHAAAWRAELRRRYQIADAGLQVRSGDPASTIAVAADRVDLVVLCWSGRAAAGRSNTARRVLDDRKRPILLIQ
jgi:hypothetical protein